MSAGRALIDAVALLEALGIAPGHVVADFGCGRSGHLVLPAARLVGDEGRVYAVDIVPDVLRMLQQHCPHAGVCNVDTVWGDMERKGGVPIPDQSVHHVFCVNNLWCVQNIDHLLSEMQRVLAPEGSAYVIDWEEDSTHPVAPPVPHRSGIEEVADLLLAKGVRVEEIPVGPHHWGLRLDFSRRDR